MSKIKFKSKWFEKCIRDYLKIPEGEITQEQLNVIKYFTIETTHSIVVEFSKQCVPEKFDFEEEGEEWEYRCISDTGRYEDVKDFIIFNKDKDFIYLELTDEALDVETELRYEREERKDEEDEEKTDEELLQEEEDIKLLTKGFKESVKEYWPRAEDYKGAEDDEKACISGMIFPEDFRYLKNVEVLRLKNCEWDIHTLGFLKELPRLKILELGEVCFTDLDGIEKLIGLDMLTIWSN